MHHRSHRKADPLPTRRALFVHGAPGTMLLALLVLRCGPNARTSDVQPVTSSVDEVRGGRWRCGDGVCNRNETCSTCMADCSARCVADAGASPSGSTDAGDNNPTDGGSEAADSATPSISGGPDCRDRATWPSAWTALEEEVLVLVNRHRSEGAMCGSTTFLAAPPLTEHRSLDQAARCHSLDMATDNYFSHTGEDGSTPSTRASAAGYTGDTTSENIAGGYSTARSVVDAWMASPGHCANIMSTRSTEVGAGYAFDSSSKYDHYWTLDFGTE